jgi:hypothetical protein
LGPDEVSLDLVPPFAALDFIAVRTFVQTALSADFEFKVLHGVGDEYCRTVESRIVDCAIENPARGTDEGVTSEVFVISGLLSDHHQRGVLRPFARHNLGRILVQWTAGALRFCPAKSGERAGERIGHLQWAEANPILPVPASWFCEPKFPVRRRSSASATSKISRFGTGTK